MSGARLSRPAREERGEWKTARLSMEHVSAQGALPRKPGWIRARAMTHPRVNELKRLLRAHRLHTVCEEAACPNIGECFANGAATFMILGDRCTRRCPFCDVAHGRPGPVDGAEPANLARAVRLMKLDYVVITSVDRDDLKDGGAMHFADCIRAVRAASPGIFVITTSSPIGWSRI